jgi:hypothetical protein
MTGFASDGVSAAGTDPHHHGTERARWHLGAIEHDASNIGQGHQFRAQAAIPAGPSARASLGPAQHAQDSGRHSPFVSLFERVRRAIPTAAERNTEVLIGAPFGREADPEQRGIHAEPAGRHDADRADNAMPGTMPVDSLSGHPQQIRNGAPNAHDDVLARMAKPHGFAFHALANLRANWPHLPVMPPCPTLQISASSLSVGPMAWVTTNLPDNTVAVRIASDRFGGFSDLAMIIGGGQIPQNTNNGEVLQNGYIINPSLDMLYYVKGIRQLSFAGLNGTVQVSVECYIDEAG